MRVSLLQRVFDAIAPRRCVICGKRLAAEEEDICLKCNYPLPRTGFLQSPYDNPLVQCFWGRIRYIEKGTAFIYHSYGSDASYPIYSLKYEGNRDIGFTIGRMMGQEMVRAGFLDDIDVLLPVPLAESRLQQRGYNQSEVIAKGIAEVAQRPVLKKVITRTSFHGSQTALDRWQRNENVAGAFHLADAAAVEGKHVLFIDDIITTGATMTACASVLDDVPGIRISVAAIGFVSHE